jgi:hypothetical protein
MGMTYMQSSLTEYMSMYVAGRVPTDPLGTMETMASAVQPGQAPYHGFATIEVPPYRAGDFSGITVDPTDGTFWAANEYATSSTRQAANWGTAIAHFQLSNPVPPPTITSVTADGNNPDTVIGTSTHLQASATDAGATITSYTWAVTGGPTGVTFDTNNGTSAGNSVIATFTQAGTYTFQVTVTDSLLGSSTGTVSVTVTPTPTSVSVTPGTATVADLGTKTFSATAFDQFNKPLASQPITWSVQAPAGGSISSAGVYSAPSSGHGTDTVVATAVGTTKSGTASVTYAQAPTITSTTADGNNTGVNSPYVTTHKSVQLAVAASDPNGIGGLNYAWSVFSGPAAAFSNNTVTTPTASFTQAGNYVFQVVVTDSYGVTSTSKVFVNVQPVLMGISVSPATATLKNGQSQQFIATGIDQFNNVMSVPITWQIKSGPSGGSGSLTTSGFYTAPSSATGTVVIEAFDGSVIGTATITVTKKHH